MNTSTRNALNAYQKVDVDARVSGASAHQLIAMLYERAISAIGAAKSYMQRGEIAGKGESISKAIAIIDEGLKISLNEAEGGELAVNLKALYEYMTLRLLHANVHNDAAALDEVARLLGQLKSAWDEIGKPVAAAQAADSMHTAQAA